MPKKKHEKGFSIIELLVVVSVLIVLLTAAVPGLLRARKTANQSSAVQSLRTIYTAQHLYFMRSGVYAALADLAPEGTLDAHLSSGSKSGYSFVLTLSPDQKTWSCVATSEEDPTQLQSYFIDNTGVIRCRDGAGANGGSPPLSN